MILLESEKEFLVHVLHPMTLQRALQTEELFRKQKKTLTGTYIYIHTHIYVVRTDRSCFHLPHSKYREIPVQQVHGPGEQSKSCEIL